MTYSVHCYACVYASSYLRARPEGTAPMLHTDCFAKLMDLLECLQWAWKRVRLEETAPEKRMRQREQRESHCRYCCFRLQKLLRLLFDYRFINLSACKQQLISKYRLLNWLSEEEQKNPESKPGGYFPSCSGMKTLLTLTYVDNALVICKCH